MKKIIVLVIITWISLGCPIKLDNDPCNLSYYNFNLPVNLTPIDSVLNIDDTIKINTTFPNLNWDRDFNHKFLFDDVLFYPGIEFAKIDTFYGTKMGAAVENFDIYYDTSRHNVQFLNGIILFDFFYSGDEYTISFDIVPKKIGVYYIAFFSEMKNYIEFLDVDTIYAQNSDCVNDNWIPYFFINEGSENNNNKELLKQSPDPLYNSKIYDLWDNRFGKKEGGYCFKVE